VGLSISSSSISADTFRLAEDLTVLLIEDNVADTELNLKALRDGGVFCQYKRISKKNALREELGRRNYDLILTDFNLGDWDAIEALDILKEIDCELPVILVTGLIGEANVVECFRRGVVNCVLKDGLDRLPLAVRQATFEQQLRAEQRRAGEALRASEDRFRRIVTFAPIGIYQAELGGSFIFVNDGLVKMLGYASAGELRARNLTRDIFFTGSDRDNVANRLLAAGETVNMAVRWKKKDGTLLWVELTVHSVLDEGGRILYLEGFVNDVTHRKNVEEALAQHETLLSALVESALDAIITIDHHGRILEYNPAAERIFGHPREHVIGRELVQLIVPLELRTSQRESLRDLIKDPEASLAGRPTELNAVRADRSEFPVEWVTVRVGELVPPLFTCFIRDITERKRAEAALQESEIRFRQMAESIHEVFWLSNATKGLMLYVSPAYAKIWGRPCEELFETALAWLKPIHEDDRERVAAAMPKQIKGTYDEQYRIVRPDGAIRWIRDKAFPIFDENGTVIRIAGIAEDITEHRQLETKFLHSQKLESVGRLAGGIAHDFNNLMTAIGTFARLALDSLEPDTQARNDIEQVIAAGDRAASVTRQLLAFARQQPLKLEVVDPNAIVTNLRKMLTRIVREDIEVVLQLDPCVRRIKVDPGQLEQCLMNLVVNSRDAMPGPGRISIATSQSVVHEIEAARREIIPGIFSLVSVTDTGHGMPPEVLSHIFEPFFTTKEVGKGTGLGLAVVYGIVRQCGGFLDLVSHVGEGTTVRLFFPEATEKAEIDSFDFPAPAQKIGDATILVVEDECELRAGLARVLKSAGYVVLEAGDGEQALALVGLLGKARIDLVISDVVMPKMNGPDFAERLKQVRPDLKLIFMSGHADEAFAAGGELRVALRKPFIPQVLLSEVAKALLSSA
jgi:PAS domain S-box-containing protein